MRNHSELLFSREDEPGSKSGIYIIYSYDVFNNKLMCPMIPSRKQDARWSIKKMPMRFTKRYNHDNDLRMVIWWEIAINGHRVP